MTSLVRLALLGFAKAVVPPAPRKKMVLRVREELKALTRRTGARITELQDALRLAHELDDPDAHILDRFATSLQRERQDFNGRMLTIRRSDLRVLASCMGRSLDELGSRLEQLGLRAAVAAG